MFYAKNCALQIKQIKPEQKESIKSTRVYKNNLFIK